MDTLKAVGTYRKKPVMVDAIQFDGTNTEACCRFIGRENIASCGPGEYIGIYTLEGAMTANVGDWIIKEPFPTATRKFYPCKPDIFAATYESVLALSPSSGAPVETPQTTGAGHEFKHFGLHDPRYYAGLCATCGDLHPSQPSPEAAPAVTPDELVIVAEPGGAEHALAFAEAHGLEVAGLTDSAVPLAPTPPELTMIEQMLEDRVVALITETGDEEAVRRALVRMTQRLPVLSSPSPGAVETPEASVAVTERLEIVDGDLVKATAWGEKLIVGHVMATDPFEQTAADEQFMERVAKGMPEFQRAWDREMTFRERQLGRALMQALRSGGSR